MSNLLNESPLYSPTPKYGIQATSDKGEQIMNKMLLSQYQNSPNLKEYYMCYIKELDFLFEQIEEVYLGRFLEYAIGAQLDVIGVILQQPRSVILPNIWFGLSDNGVTIPQTDGMADPAKPALGGLFKDANLTQVAEPLDDITYRRVLMAKATVLNRDTIDLDLAYYMISILLGRTPSTFELRDQDSTVPNAKRSVELIVSSGDVSAKDESLLHYMSKYFVPVGITFTIQRV